MSGTIVADKSVDRYGPIIAYKIKIFLIGRSAPSDEKRGLTGGECVPISPNNSHLELRSPVTPEGPVPFPYSGYYIHTTIALRCRLAQAHISGPEVPLFTLPKRVITRLGVVKMADLSRARDRLTVLNMAKCRKTLHPLIGRKNCKLFALISHGGLPMLRKSLREVTRFTFVYSVIRLMPRKSLEDCGMSLSVSMFGQISHKVLHSRTPKSSQMTLIR